MDAAILASVVPVLTSRMREALEKMTNAPLMEVGPGLKSGVRTVSYTHLDVYKRQPPLLFRRRPPQSNCPPNNVPRLDSKAQVRIPMSQGWYPNGRSMNAKALTS